MSLFRFVLMMLVLAVLGGLVWQLLATDPGLVLVRFRGQELSSTVPAAVLLILTALIALWLVLRLVLLPFQGWRRLRRKQAGQRLSDALTALHEGRPLRAAKLLEKVAHEPSLRGPALVTAAQAAREADQGTEAERLLTQASAAGVDLPVRIERAEQALRIGQAREAVDLLSTVEEALPPRALLVKTRALAESGRADAALALVPALRSCRARPESELDALEQTLVQQSLREADSSQALAGRWNRLAKTSRLDAGAAGVFAERMAAFGLEDDATAAIEKSLGQHWSEALAALYGKLPGGHQGKRLKIAEDWLRRHPDSPALALSLARLCQAQRLSVKSENYLHRAIAQGQNAEAWEMLAELMAGKGDEPGARLCLQNALRAGRNQPPLDLPERSLQQQIGDQAVLEERDQHGMPRLRES